MGRVGSSEGMRRRGEGRCELEGRRKGGEEVSFVRLA